MSTTQGQAYIIDTVIKDYLPRFIHGFRKKYSDKISLDNMLYFHNCTSFEKIHSISITMQ